MNGRTPYGLVYLALCAAIVLRNLKQKYWKIQFGLPDLTFSFFVSLSLSVCSQFVHNIPSKYFLYQIGSRFIYDLNGFCLRPKCCSTKFFGNVLFFYSVGQKKKVYTSVRKHLQIMHSMNILVS